MEISNSMVAVLVVAAIAISVAGTVTTLNLMDQFVYTPAESVTGQLTGTVNVTVNKTTAISWVKQVVRFYLNPIDIIC